MNKWKSAVFDSSRVSLCVWIIAPLVIQLSDSTYQRRTHACGTYKNWNSVICLVPLRDVWVLALYYSLHFSLRLAVSAQLRSCNGSLQSSLFSNLSDFVVMNLLIWIVFESRMCSNVKQTHCSAWVRCILNGIARTRPVLYGILACMPGAPA
jgi:hypothetical protein